MCVKNDSTIQLEGNTEMDNHVHEEHRTRSEGPREINPLPNSGDKEPSTIITFSLLEQGLYDGNKGHI